MVLRSGLARELEDRLRAALLSIDTGTSPVLAGFGLERFVPVGYSDYAPEERVLRKCAGIPATRQG